MGKVKKALLFALALLPIAILAGIFVGFYQVDIYGGEILDEAIRQLGSVEILIVITVVQTVCYAVGLGFAGYFLADKLGLWRPFKFEKNKLLVTLVVSVLGGIIFSLDYWTFGNMIEGIQAGTRSGMTIFGNLAAILYGGVIEEVMLRLFFMSLIALIIWKVFFRKYDKEHIPTGVFVAANIIAVLVFAAGHLPATITIFGELTGLIVFRCFLLNGCFGLVFGYFYRKYGIFYSMMSHAIFHIVSRLIWFCAINWL